MKKILSLILISLCFYISGCSVPTAVTYKQLYSFTKEEKKIKGSLSKKKEIIIKDFRENDMYEEDITELKEMVEKYIASHPDISEVTRLNLQELKVSEGLVKEEVRLLLGQPDKVLRNARKNDYTASEVWIYSINKLRAFNVFIIPVFLVHEGYYLYFKNDTLAALERHSLKQIVQQGPGAGVFEYKEKKEETTTK